MKVEIPATSMKIFERVASGALTPAEGAILMLAEDEQARTRRRNLISFGWLSVWLFDLGFFLSWLLWRLL